MLHFLNAFIVFFIIGCATNVEYKEVYIPIRCNVELPYLPKKSNDIIENHKNIVIYTKELERVVNCCVKGVCD